MISRNISLNNGESTKLLAMNIGQIFDKCEYLVGVGPTYLLDMLKLHAGRIGIAPAETSPNLQADRLW